MQVDVTCQMCGRSAHYTCTAKQFREWRLGAPIQSAIPTLTKAQREFLISKICGPCFTKLENEDV